MKLAIDGDKGTQILAVRIYRLLFNRIDEYIYNKFHCD